MSIDGVISKYINEEKDETYSYIVNPETREVLHKLKSGGTAWSDVLYKTNHSIPLIYKNQNVAIKMAQKYIPNANSWESYTRQTLTKTYDFYDKDGKLNPRYKKK